MHKTVLLHQSIDALNLKKGDVYLDGTLGGGGHTELALEIANKNHDSDMTIIGLDQDEDALARCQKKFEDIKNLWVKKENGVHIYLIHSNFRFLDKVLDNLKEEGKIKEAKVDKIILDIGLSSDQLEGSNRGFTFKKDEPLKMTFKANPDINKEDLTAEFILNNWQEESIADIIYGWGEERYARRIAKKIVEARAIKPIKTTFELVEIIKKATPFTYHHGKIHPATKTFQALRIAVNDELGALRDGLEKGFDRLRSGGRMAIISFHSLEDRIVKNFFREKKESDQLILINKKPIEADFEELNQNPRARSAKLRVIEKI